MQHGHGDVITDCDAKNEEACKEQGGARTYDKYAEGSDVSTDDRKPRRRSTGRGRRVSRHTTIGEAFGLTLADIPRGTPTAREETPNPMTAAACKRVAAPFKPSLTRRGIRRSAPPMRSLLQQRALTPEAVTPMPEAEPTPEAPDQPVGPVKRKPGRPKKGSELNLKRHLRKLDTAPSKEPTTHDLLSNRAAKDPNAPKRPRGRPRKIRPEGEPQKKRGRPRKPRPEGEAVPKDSKPQKIIGVPKKLGTKLKHAYPNENMKGVKKAEVSAREKLDKIALSGQKFGAADKPESLSNATVKFRQTSAKDAQPTKKPRPAKSGLQLSGAVKKVSGGNKQKVSNDQSMKPEKNGLLKGAKSKDKAQKFVKICSQPGRAPVCPRQQKLASDKDEAKGKGKASSIEVVRKVKRTSAGSAVLSTSPLKALTKPADPMSAKKGHTIPKRAKLAVDRKKIYQQASSTGSQQAVTFPRKISASEPKAMSQKHPQKETREKVLLDELPNKPRLTSTGFPQRKGAPPKNGKQLSGMGGQQIDEALLMSDDSRPSKRQREAFALLAQTQDLKGFPTSPQRQRPTFKAVELQDQSRTTASRHAACDRSKLAETRPAFKSKEDLSQDKRLGMSRVDMEVSWTDTTPGLKEPLAKVAQNATKPSQPSTEHEASPQDKKAARLAERKRKAILEFQKAQKRLSVEPQRGVRLAFEPPTPRACSLQNRRISLDSA